MEKITPVSIREAVFKDAEIPVKRLRFGNEYAGFQRQFKR